MKVWIAIALMWIGLFFTIQALTFADQVEGHYIITDGDKVLKDEPLSFSNKHLNEVQPVPEKMVYRNTHYRCEQDKMNPALITLIPIDGGLTIELLCTNCSCGADK